MTDAQPLDDRNMLAYRSEVPKKCLICDELTPTLCRVRAEGRRDVERFVRLCASHWPKGVIRP